MWRRLWMTSMPVPIAVDACNIIAISYLIKPCLVMIHPIFRKPHDPHTPFQNSLPRGDGEGLLQSRGIPKSPRKFRSTSLHFASKRHQKRPTPVKLHQFILSVALTLAHGRP